MLLKIPYYSQKIDVKDLEWKDRACGIASLKMVMDFYKKDAPNLDEFVKIGVEMGAYGSSGWIHQGLVDVAARFNFAIYRKEFRSDDSEEAQGLLDQGLNEIVGSLEDGNPVLVSAVKQFKEPDKFHIIVIVGFEGDSQSPEGFYYHDPDALTIEEGKDRFVPIDIFRKYWRKMAIFIHPSNS